MPPPDLAGPKILLGVVWAGVTTVAVLIGPVLLALWLAPIAAVAAAQIARSWKGHRSGRQPSPEVAMGVAGVVVLGAAFGLVACAAVAGVAVIGGAAWAASQNNHEGAAKTPAFTADLVLSLICAAVPATAAVGPILLRDDGLVAALVVLTYMFVYDAGSWIIGSGTRHHWMGPLAGMACIGSVTIAVAAIFPQFQGNSAWELGVLAILLAPLGPPIATLVLGGHRARVPALRRLDSLLVLGPLWALAAAAMIG